jgi:hypothetical protein
MLELQTINYWEGEKIRFHFLLISVKELEEVLDLPKAVASTRLLTRPEMG